MHDFARLVLNMFGYGLRRFLAVAGVCLLLVGAAYLLCRRRGSAFPWGKALTAVFLAGYLAVLLYATLLRQVGLGEHQANLHLFRAWREAWNTFALQNWLNVLLNIALFMPLGFLLPLAAAPFRRWYAALAAGLGVTLAVESAQYVLGRGMFDVDDLFTNTLGAMLGWCVVMVGLTRRERKWRPYTALPVAFCVVMGAIFGGYRWKEYGNLPEAPAFAADLRGVEWQVAAEQEDGAGKVPIYRAEPFTKETCGVFGEEFALRAGVSFPDAYYYDDLTIFANHSTGDFLNVWYHDRRYEFTASSPSGLAGAEGEEGLLREKLAEYGIDPPAEAEFVYEGEGWHRFTASLLPQGETVVNGELRCRYLEDGRLKDIDNSLVALTPCGEEEILTGQEALGRLRKGLFQGGEMLERAKVQRVEVLSWELTYRADTKGFYQPVYEFAIRPEGMETGTVLVPAMR